VSDSARPVQAYVTDCLSKISKEALIKIGQTGGYSSLDNAHLTISPVPYKSDALVFEPQIIPYWYYLKSCSENSIGCLHSNMPPLCKSGSICIIDSRGENSIEQGLDDYVTAHINDCVNNFEPFNDQFDVAVTGPVSTETIISENNVGFKLNYPLAVSVKGSASKEDIPYFYAAQDVNLKNIYLLAKNIFDAESKQNFLELTTMNLISIYSGVDKDRLPPISTIEFTGGSPQMWTRTGVKEMFQNDILPYLSFVRIAGTDNGNTVVSTEADNYTLYAQGIYHSLTYKFSNDTYDLDADIIYPYSDIYLNIGNSEIIKGEKLFIDPHLQFITNFVGFSMTQYKFKYDISYPLIVKITDPAAFNGEGYIFNYAMEANIRQNVPVNGNITIINVGGVNGVDLNSELQKVNRTITINTIDRHTKKPLPDVLVTYTCGQTYNIGATELSSTGKKATLEDRFPYCQFGGQISFEKEGYMGTTMDYNNPEGTDAKSFDIELWPIQEKNIQVQKRTPQNVQNIVRATSNIMQVYKSEASNLTVNDSIFLNLARINESAGEQDIPIIGFLQITASATNTNSSNAFSIGTQSQTVQTLFNSGQINESARDIMLSEISSLNTTITAAANNPVTAYSYGLVPGIYTVDATLLHIPTITIPQKTMKICPGLDAGVADICIGGWETIEFPEQNLTTFPVGGGKQQFTLTENDVYNNNNTLTFYVLEMPLPNTWDELENYQTIDTYQQDKLYMLSPRLE